MSNKANVYYKQCTFSSPTTSGELMETAWLPEKFATEGQKVYFGKKSDKPERIWTVISAGDHRVSEKYLVDHERDYKTQREASDI